MAHLKVGTRYTIKKSYEAPKDKYLKGVSSIPEDALRGMTLQCIRLSASGRSAWFKYAGEEFWVKSVYLKEPNSFTISPGKPLCKSKKATYVVTKPKMVSSAFWIRGMDKFIGQVAFITETNPSDWVRINIDGGDYMWNKNWLVKTSTNGNGPIMTHGIKVRKLTLQEELAAIDSKYDAKIRNIKWTSKYRQSEITRKAAEYKEYLETDKTPQNVSKYLKNGTETGSRKWVKVVKYGLAGLTGVATVSTLVWAIITLM